MMAETSSAAALEVGICPAPELRCAKSVLCVRCRLLSDSLLRLRQALDGIKGAVPEELRASLDECRALYESKYVLPACIVVARGVQLMCVY
eukprot:COSAG02_NODE_40_length_47766_cov_88.053119_2_plen_91_part_00